MTDRQEPGRAGDDQGAGGALPGDTGPDANGFWSYGAAPRRRPVFKRHDLDFENALDIDKIEALLAWYDGTS